MVATKNPKTPKYSYAERVLGAFTQVQREHRRHSVHLATLRAQVKKNAQAHRDKLGPQWAHWVGKAVHKLEQEGVLASEASGNVTITPDGKKAIQHDRRIVTSAKTALPAPEQEEQVLKQVTQLAALGQVRGIKRGRTEGPDSDDDTDRDEYTPRARSRPSTKRTRTSVVSTHPGKKPISKMTKAELRAEIVDLNQARQEEIFWRGTSPLTDLDNEEEMERLREALKERDEQLLAIRRDLAQASDKEGSEEQQAEREQDIERFMTPESDIHFDLLPSSPTQPRLPNHISGRDFAPLELGRTQPGSRISRLSKRPTPAPSAHTGEVDEDDLDHDDVTNAHDDSLMTPQATPTHPRPRGRFEETGTISDGEKQGTLINKISAVSGGPWDGSEESRDRNRTLQDLQSQLSELSRKNELAERGISKRESRIAELQDGRVADEQAVSALKAELQKSRRDNEVEEGRLRERIVGLEESVNFLQDKLANEQSEMTASSAALDATRIELQKLKVDLTSITEERDALGTESLAHRERAESLQRREEELLGQIQEYENQIAIHRREYTSLNDETEKLKSENDDLTSGLAQAKLDVERHETALSLSTVLVTKLEATLTQNQAQLTSLTNQLLSLQSDPTSRDQTISDLHSTLTLQTKATAEQQSKLHESEELTDRLRDDVEVSRAEADSLRAQLEERIAQHTGLAVDLATAREMNAGLSIKVDHQDAAIRRLTQDLEFARTTITSSEDELAHMQSRCETLQGGVKVKEDEVKMLEETVLMTESLAGKFRDQLKVNEQNLRDLHDQLDEARRKIMTTEASLSTEISERNLCQQGLDEANNAIVKMNAESERLRTRLEEAQAGMESMETKLREVVSSRESLSAALRREEDRAKSIESDLVETVEKVHEAEREIDELRNSKEADAVTIANLKNVFATLRDNQLGLLEEAQLKVSSAVTAPMPRTRLAEYKSL